MTTGSSPVETVDTPDADGAVGVDASTATADANAAASSPTDDTKSDAKEPTSMLEAVIAATKSTEVEPTSSSENGEGSDATADAEGDQPDGEADGADEEVPEPFHKHPAWQRLKGQRDTFKASHDTLQNLHGFMSEAGLDLDEVNKGFEIMRLMKKDPAKALEELKPFFVGLMTYTGKVLPSDLRERVDQGAISDDLAAELAERRSREQMAQQAAARASAEAAHRMQAEIVGAMTEWERNWQSSDPDYSKKQKLVQREIENRVLRGERPANGAAAKALADKCRKEVETQLGLIVPKQQRRELNPVTGGASSSSAKPEPKDMMDVIRLAVGGAG